jgi:inhibitor of KinA
MPYEIYELGDRGLTFQLRDQASLASHTHLKMMKSWIDKNTFTGLLDIILSYQSLTLLIDRFIANQSGIKDITAFCTNIFQRANDQAINGSDETQSRIWKIPVCYDPVFAFDLDALSQEKNILREDVIRFHTNKDYNVYMIGFLPGFPYLGFVDDRISHARKDAPMAKVPGGSVGIAGRQTGIYPMDSPGGWQIIGRTPFRLFDPLRNPPVELQPGDVVRFYEISLDEFHKISERS